MPSLMMVSRLAPVVLGWKQENPYRKVSRFSIDLSSPGSTYKVGAVDHRGPFKGDGWLKPKVSDWGLRVWDTKILRDQRCPGGRVSLYRSTVGLDRSADAAAARGCCSDPGEGQHGYETKKGSLHVASVK
jgi:hypothetical protein